MKYLLTLLLTINLLNASMFLGATNDCIEDFYTKDSSFYFLRSSDGIWYSTTDINYASTLLSNFNYDVGANTCTPNQAYILGMQETEYNFLLGIVGVIFGAVFMFFTIQIFTTVGGRR